VHSLQYRIDIDVDREVVWAAMTDPDSYKEWASAFSANSQFVGEWKQGSFIDFIDPDRGGTRALLEEVRPLERIHARHVATISADGRLDTESDVAKKWIGSLESYTLTETSRGTVLVVDIFSHEDFVEMLNDGWAKALPLLKSLCERNGP
jgi:uncharacterized protein YndB with AHSA1/START domain